MTSTPILSPAATGIARRKPLRLAAIALLAGLSLSTTACSNLSAREQRTLTGGALGVAGGAAIAAVAGGGIVTGALIGGAAGTVVGALTSNGR